MREIRARISQRHGIELTTQQIQELAARRLEAILDPRTVNPSLLEQLRRGAGKVPETTSADATPAYVFENRTIYESHNGLLRFIRRLLNPVLTLFFNPNPIAHALNAQTTLNAKRAAREAEGDRRQAEWNALHFEILQRLVTETARVSIEMQSLASRVESLGARVDFNDRRVRSIEAGPQRPLPRQPEPRPPEPRPFAAATPAGPTAAPPEHAGQADARATEGTPAEGVRRKRRRRRGRRSGTGLGDVGAAADPMATGSEMDAGEGPDSDDAGDDEFVTSGDADPMAGTGLAAEPGAGPHPEAQEPPTGQPTAAAAPPPFPQDDAGAATTPPTPPRDEPSPPVAEPPPDTGRVDR